VTNNNGFWIGRLDLLTLLLQSLLIRISLQQLAINFQPNPSSLTAGDSLHSRSRSTTDYSLGIPRYIASGRTPRKTLSQQFVGVFTNPLPRNGRPIIPRYASAGTCLATRCLAMGMARTTLRTLLAIPYCCTRVFRVLPRNGSTCHSIYPIYVRVHTYIPFSFEEKVIYLS
jgi:hypothetical protein